MKPLVTVLVVTYNHVNTFEKAIESVLAQKTNFDFNIWVLDDCSTDGTSDLVRKYAEFHPEKIIPVIRKQNIGAIQNVFQALQTIDTKYYATLESDDYWCDEDKLQTQVDILERNSDCSMCCHNTYRRYPNNERHLKHNAPYINAKVKTRKFKFPQKICRKQYIEPHYSSRLYRTSCLHLDKLKNPVMVCYDIASMFWFLQFGKMYYIDKLMSVYNISYQGVYSGADSKTQDYMSANVINLINKEFDYKYNSMFLSFFKKRIYVSLAKIIFLTYFAKKENLAQYYDEILENFTRGNNQRINKKTLFSLSIPLSKRKKICLEVRREKEM